MTTQSLLVAAKVVVLVLGAAVALLAFQGYRRNGSRLMLSLSLAFALVALGSFLEGLLFEILGWELAAVHTVESAFVLAGLGILVYVLRPRGSRP